MPETNPGQGPGVFKTRGPEYDAPTIPGGGGASEDENNRNVEDALANRAFYRTESLSGELIASAENPHELFFGLRRLEELMEDGNIPGNLTEHYTPPRELSIMHDRAKNLKISINDLQNGGMIVKDSYDNGYAIPSKRKFASLSIAVDEVPVIIEDKQGRKRQVGTDYEFYYGTPEERTELAQAYERAILELEARAIIGEHVGVRLNLDFRDNLSGLVNIMHSGRMPKFKSDHLTALFNMPDIAESEKNPENKLLGDQVEEALFLNLIMLNSGTKKQMQGLLERPGAKHLIAKMAKEEEARRGSGTTYTYDNWVKDNIGDIDNWVDDIDRELGTFKEEAKNGLRKDLTKWSNIPAFYGEPGEFGGDDEVCFIEKTVGGLVNSVEASWVVASLMKTIGGYASEGYVALPNGTSSLPLGEGRFMSSDDTGKFWTYMLHMKEGKKGRPTGLKDMIGKIPDTAMNLFDWAQVRVELSDGTVVRRSIWDAWLGTAGGKDIRDLLTNKPTGQKTKEEGYHRLGDLNFASLDRDFHGTFTTMQWLDGNDQGPTGVYVDGIKVEFKKDEFKLNEMKKMWKYIGILHNPLVLTKGSTHLYDTKNIPILQKNYFRNLMYARIHSYCFTTEILTDTIPLFEADINKIGVPVPVVVKENIKEMLKGNPRKEEEIYSHYLDSYHRVTTLVEKNLGLMKVSTPGTDTNRIELLKEKFEPEDPNEKSLMGYVGRVTGKKTK